MYMYATCFTACTIHLHLSDRFMYNNYSFNLHYSSIKYSIYYMYVCTQLSYLIQCTCHNFCLHFNIDCVKVLTCTQAVYPSKAGYLMLLPYTITVAATRAAALRCDCMYPLRCSSVTVPVFFCHRIPKRDTRRSLTTSRPVTVHSPIECTLQQAT